MNRRLPRLPRRRPSAAAALAFAAALAAIAPGHARPERPPAPEALRPVTHAIARIGEFALVARDGGLDVFDAATLSDPAGPEPPIGTLGLASSVYDVLPWSDSVVFLAAGSDGVVLVDVSDPEAPEAVHRVETRGSARRLARRADVLYVADEIGGLAVVDAARPERARLRRTVSTRSQVRSVSVHEDRLATAEGAAGVRVFDLARPDQPREIVAVERRDSAADVLLGDGVLWVADGRRGLRLYRSDGRDRWRLTGSTLPDERVRSLSPRIDGAFAALADGRLRMLAIDGDGRPSLVSTVVLPRSIAAGRATPSATPGTWWIAAGVGGVAVVDLEDPASPRVLRPRARAFEVRWGEGP